MLWPTVAPTRRGGITAVAVAPGNRPALHADLLALPEGHGDGVASHNGGLSIQLCTGHLARLPPARAPAPAQHRRRTIDQHVNRHGNCADCGSNWPYQSAELAAFTLGAL